MPMSVDRAKRLAPLLEALVRHTPPLRVAADPVELPRRYSDPGDVEVAGLLAASLAYGRVSLFKPQVEALLTKLGRRPARTLSTLTVAQAGELTRGFVYRFNVASDLVALLLAMGRARSEFGSLEGLFVSAGLRGEVDAPDPVRRFAQRLRALAPVREIRQKVGPLRGFDHLLPAGGGAQKRLNLFLRWMVRGPDEVDLGIWKRVRPASLIIPLDTHVGRLARLVGLTTRRDQSLRTAADITESLRLIDPDDPVRFDFALCHLGMSGACPLQPRLEACRSCVLVSECTAGRRVARTTAPSPR